MGTICQRCLGLPKVVSVSYFRIAGYTDKWSSRWNEQRVSERPGGRSRFEHSHLYSFLVNGECPNDRPVLSCSRYAKECAQLMIFWSGGVTCMLVSLQIERPSQ